LKRLEKDGKNERGKKEKGGGQEIGPESPVKKHFGPKAGQRPYKGSGGGQGEGEGWGKTARAAGDPVCFEGHDANASLNGKQMKERKRRHQKG